MVRILHFADLHLDRAFSSVGMFSSEADKRRGELRAALRRIVDRAIEREVDALTIGGDLYEHERETLDTGMFLKQQFERLGHRPVLIAPGNHDPCLPDSLYRTVEWPSNVHVFPNLSWEPVKVGDITIYGIGHTGPETRESALRNLRVPSGETAVALFHGSDAAAVPQGKTPHCPFERDDAVQCGAAFLLLGHYHRHYAWPEGSPRFAYPGSPEPLDFGETGPHFVLEVEVTPGQVHAEPVQFNAVSYVETAVDVSGMTTSDQVRGAIEALAQSVDQRPDIMRVELVGETERELDINAQALYASTAQRFRYLDIVDHTTPSLDLVALQTETTTRGAFVRIIDARIASAETAEGREVLVRAMRYGLQAFDGREIRQR